MNVDLHLMIDVDVVSDDQEHDETLWFHRMIACPFMPTKDLNLDLALGESEEGELLDVDIISVHWSIIGGYCWAHGKIWARNDWKSEGKEAAIEWYGERGFEAFGPDLPKHCGLCGRRRPRERFTDDPGYPNICDLCDKETRR